jgi:hypothetical protein
LVIPLAPATKEGLQAGIIAKEGARRKSNRVVLTLAWMRRSIPPAMQTDHGRRDATVVRKSEYDNLVQGSESAAVPFVTAMKYKDVTKWITAVMGGLFSFFVVYLGTGVFLCRMGEGPIWGPVFSIVVPGLLGLAAGIHTFRSSIQRDGVRSFRLTQPPEYHPFEAGHCQTCGYDLTGNESGVCPECGSEV